MSDKVIRVLSIEDNPADARLVQEKLAAAQHVSWDLPHFEVEHVVRLEAALVRLGDGAFDVVLSDLDLPDSQAGETVATLREHIPQMPLVVLTGREDETLARKSVHAGVQDYLYKNEATGSLLARSLMYALERQQVHIELEQRVADRTAELKKSKQALQREKDKVERYLNIAASIIIALDTQGRITLLNETGADILECAPDAVIGQNWFDMFLPADNQEEIKAVFEQLMTGAIQPVRYVENAVLTGQGTEKMIRWHNTPLKDEAGEIVGILSSGEDVTARQRMEDALRARTAMLANAEKLVRMGSWVWDIPTNRLTLSESWQDIHGYYIGELSRSDLLPIAHPDDVLEIERAFAQALQDGVPYDIEHRIIRPEDGTVRYIHAYGEVIYDDDGDPVKMYGAAQDITERKRAEEALEEERAFLSMVLENIAEAIIICNAEGRIVRFNEAARRLHGVPEQPLPPDQWAGYYDLYRSDGTTPLPLEEIPLFRALQGEHVQDAEIVVDPNHSEPRSLVCNGQALTDATGEITGAIVTMHDITPRKRVEENLRETTRRFHALLAHSPALIHIFDEEGRYLLVGEATAEAMGLPHEEIIGKTFADLLPPEMVATFMRRVEALKEDRAVLFVEDQILVNGEEQVFESLLFPLSDEAEMSTYAAIATDVTARKRAEEALKRSNEELEQFAYVISHDLQEPARMVQSYMNLLARRYQGQLDEQADKFIDYAVDGAKRMQEMINALLDLSRVGTRGQAFAPTDADAVLERTLRSLDQAIEAAEAQVTHDPLPTVMADPAQLAQVFQNLVANGIKFRCENVPPHVHISAEREGDAWRFSIRDNGIGIDPEQAGWIFQIFRRLHTEKEYPGLGIGLALCKRIVARHGGRIWVESAPGAGSTFYFTIPA